MENTARDKATARPWKISSCEHNDKSDIAQIIYGDIYGGGTIAELPKHKHLDCIGGKTAMYRNKGDKELAEANASLIVKAVNNHEALLEACREAQSYILSLKGKEFNIKNAEYFHISAVLASALNQ
jgi:hypothetical protein